MTIGLVIWSILVALIANEFWDITPWIAVRVLRLAAWIDARRPGEAGLLFADWHDRMVEKVPGKLFKLFFALKCLIGVAVARHVELIEQRCRARVSSLIEAVRQPSADWNEMIRFVAWAIVLGVLVTFSVVGLVRVVVEVDDELRHVFTMIFSWFALGLVPVLRPFLAVWRRVRVMVVGGRREVTVTRVRSGDDLRRPTRRRRTRRRRL